MRREQDAQDSVGACRGYPSGRMQRLPILAHAELPSFRKLSQVTAISPLQVGTKVSRHNSYKCLRENQVTQSIVLLDRETTDT